MITNRVMQLNQEDVESELIRVSILLRDLLPDPSLGPMERIERLARVVEGSIQIGNFHRTARMKLKEIDERLNELVPDKEMTNIERVEYLVAQVNRLVPEKTDRLCQKLQYIGDRRLRDNGSIASPNWSPELMKNETAVKLMRESGKTPSMMTYIDESLYY